MIGSRRKVDSSITLVSLSLSVETIITGFEFGFFFL